MVQPVGLAALKGLLDDLGAGVTINEALPLRAKTSLDELDRDFARFALERAVKVAPDLTWDEPELPADADSKAALAWLEKHPRSFSGLRRLAARLVAEEKWAGPGRSMQELKALYPEYIGAENAYVMLAAVYRRTVRPRRGTQDPRRTGGAWTACASRPTCG